LKNKKSYYLFLFTDIVFVTVSFLLMIWLKPGTWEHYLPAYIRPFLGFSFAWIFISMLGGKYSQSKSSLLDSLKQILLTNTYSITIVLILIYLFNRLEYSRMVVLGTIIIATLLEIFYIILFTAYKKEKENHIDIALNYKSKPKEISDKKRKITIIEFPELEDKTKIVIDKLANKYLKNHKELYEFINKNLKLETISKYKTKVIDSQTYYNIENYESQSQQLFINLHRLNDIKRINRYMIKVNENLVYGGFFVGNCRTLSDEYQAVFNKYPNIIAIPIYTFKFILKRIIPKIPVFKQIYFILTNGSGRHISRAEILGRLYYCGFKVVALQEMDNKLHFIVKKVSIPSNDETPSYGPLIKLTRVGLNGKRLNIYKFRTMHPYSEYLQEYIYENYDLEEGGKFKNDFRITGWGKIFRKLWIDELPQFINVFRGQIGFVGVRALSEHYFSLYPEYLQKLRTKFKPGLVPPFYVDMPKTFKEILDSEEKYLKKRAKHPILTQIEYFCKAWWNILVRKARSN